MKPRTLARLDLLAADAGGALLDEIRRHNAALATVAQQRGVLAAYRDRLPASWQSGAVVPAGQARRAGHFAAASQARADADGRRRASAERAQLERSSSPQLGAAARAPAASWQRAAGAAPRQQEARRAAQRQQPRAAPAARPPAIADANHRPDD